MDFLNNLDKVVGYMYHLNDNTSLNNTGTCQERVNHYLFYQLILIPAILITLSFAVFKTRRNILMNVLKGRPGLLYPMDALDRSSRLNYAMAFGATMFLVYAVILEGKFAIDYTGPLALKTVIVIVSMLIYGMAFFPIFACLTMGSTFGYGLGALYVWMITVVEIYRLAQCSVYWQARLAWIGQSIPHMACLVYLSLSIPVRFYLAVKGKRYFVQEETVLDAKHTLELIKKSCEGSHVQKLLKKPSPKPPPPCGIGYKILNLAKGFMYQRNADFRYSSRILSVMLVGVSLLYVLSFQLLTLIVGQCTSVIYWINWVIKKINENNQDSLPSEVRDYVWLLRDYIWLLKDFRYMVKAARICVILSVIAAFLVGFVMILHMLASYRKNLLELYRGSNKNIPGADEKSNPNLLVGCMRYAGYQVAYIAWGFIIQVVIFLLICSIFAIIITLLRAGINQWLLDGVLQIWPIVLWAIILQVLQFVVAKFVFLIDKGDLFAIDNRRFFFIYTYFMFFFNIFLGIVSCLMRIVKAIVLGALFLPRLDMSTLPRWFEFLDPGFAAYIGYLHVENAHTHPVVIVFLRLMLMNIQEERQDTELSLEHNQIEDRHCIELGTGGALSESNDKMLENQRYAVRFKWLVAYTLLNNPQIRVFRKGYIQALAKAVGEGSVVPVSDGAIVDLTRIKIPEEEKDCDLTEINISNGKLKRMQNKITATNDEKNIESRV